MIAVSPGIRDEFEDGRDDYAMDEQPLRILPLPELERPAREFLIWHQNNCYLG